MLKNVASFILICMSVLIIYTPHERLTKITDMLNINYIIPSWVFVYIASPLLFFLALFVKHQSAGFFEFLINHLRELTGNTNKDTL